MTISNRLALLLLAAGSLLASSQLSFAQDSMAAAKDGWFVRGDLGIGISAANEAYWTGPGGPPSDPRITFSLGSVSVPVANLGAGYDFGNGVRIDTTLGINTAAQFNGTFKSASDGSTTGHATSISGTTSAYSLMANLFVEPFKIAKKDMPIQPFLTGGVGVSYVSMGDWTRINPAATQTSRSWSGAGNFNMAWSVGGGVSIAMTSKGKQKGYLDLTYRYTDLGQATGGSDPINPPPSNSPTEAYNFHYASHAITVGLRFPIGN